MKRSDFNENRHAWGEAHLDAFLDGDLPPDEAAAFARLLQEDDDLAAERWLAGQVRDGLRALPRPVCPPAVTQAVLAEARRSTWRSRQERFVGRLLDAWLSLWQPALVTAALVGVVVTAALVGRVPAPPPPTAHAAEVEAALAEAKWTLAYLSEVGRHTGRSVRHEVLEAHVVAPVQEAVGALLDAETQPLQPN